MTNLQVVNISGEPWSDFLIRLVVNIVSLFCLIGLFITPTTAAKNTCLLFS